MRYLDKISTLERNILNVLNDAVSPMRQSEIRNVLIKIEKGKDVKTEILGRNIFDKVQKKRRRIEQTTLKNISNAMNDLENRGFAVSTDNDNGTKIYMVTNEGRSQ